MSLIFFGPAVLIAHWPYAGVVIAIILIATQTLLNARAGRRFDRAFFREAAVFAGLLWLIFGFYEMQIMAAMVNAGRVGEPLNFFRIDLIILIPILYLMTLAAILSIVQQLKDNGKNGRR